VSAYLDVIGSIVIAGALLLSVLNLNSALVERGIAANFSLVAQRNGTGTAAILESDLRRIGFRVPEESPSMLAAEADSIVLVGDVDTDGDLDTLSYYLGAPDDGTANPNDRRLMRHILNGDSLAVGIGVTGLAFNYYDALGAETATLGSIRDIKATLRVELTEAMQAWDPSEAAYGPHYVGNDWVVRVRPKNL
jgi:hypothetical protein